MAKLASMDAQTADQDEDLPPKPRPPRDSDCCRSDCPVCVFDLYDRELERWREAVEEIRKRRGAA